MVGMLSAIPKTPLYDRLKAAGRLDEADDPAFGTNVLPVNMSREALSDGYVRLMAELYEPQAYFDRVDDLYRDGGIVIDRAWQSLWRGHPWRMARTRPVFGLECLRPLHACARQVPDRRCAGSTASASGRSSARGPKPAVLRIYALKCAIHWHMHKFVRRLMTTEKPLVNTY